MRFCSPRCRQAAYRARKRGSWTTGKERDYLLDLEWSLGFDEGVVQATELLEREVLLHPKLLRQVLALCHPDRHPGREKQATRVTAALNTRYETASSKGKPSKLTLKLLQLQAPPRPDRKQHSYPQTPASEPKRP